MEKKYCTIVNYILLKAYSGDGGLVCVTMTHITVKPRLVLFLFDELLQIILMRHLFQSLKLPFNNETPILNDRLTCLYRVYICLLVCIRAQSLKGIFQS